MTKDEWYRQLFERLDNSKFRSSFHLKQKDIDYINEKGLDTYLAETGSNLSGGQCQRLALARALIYDSPAYIFDEASSNIDAESENYIMNEILKLAKSKTVILISHRLANVVNSDKIYVMDNGKVIENGTHNDLIEKNGLYANLWNSQFELENYGKTEE